MIIEIIVFLGILGSLVGFILGVKHYFKTWKKRNDNKKMLLAIESAEDSNACYDKFYHNMLSDVDWGRVVMVTFVIGLAVIIFWTFASSNNEPSNGNQGPAIVQAQGGGGASIINTTQDMNQTITSWTQSLTFNGAVPWWLLPGIMIIFGWIMFRKLSYTHCW